MLDENRVALALGNQDRNDLVSEAAGLDGFGRKLVGAGSELVLLLAGDAVARVTISAKAHQARVEGTPEAVGDDRVAQLGVAIAEAAACAVGEVRGVAH